MITEPDHIWVCVCDLCRGATISKLLCDKPTHPGHDQALRECAFFRLALLDLHTREAAQDATTCWVRSRYAPILSLTNWIEAVLDEANALEDRT